MLIYAHPPKKILLIDASTIRSGGGIVHLKQLLTHFPYNTHFHQIVVFGSRGILSQIPSHPQLRKYTNPLLNHGLSCNLLWILFVFPILYLFYYRNSLVLLPASLCLYPFIPFICISQNMLPFSPLEARRYGLTFMRLRLLFLRIIYQYTYSCSVAHIFLSRHACSVIRSKANLFKPFSIIPHGVDPSFSVPPHPQLPIESYSVDKPFKLIYVSTVDVYKHQPNVVRAVSDLIQQTSWAVQLTLVGPAYGPSLAALLTTLNELDPDRNWCHYLASVPHDTLPEIYRSAHLGVFASTCENLPNIVLEMMASGLPIVSSSYAPMDELIGDQDAYFDPLSTTSITLALRRLIGSPVLRSKCSIRNYNESRHYTWKRCSFRTSEFLASLG